MTSSKNDPYINIKTGILFNTQKLETQAELNKFEEILYLSTFKEALNFARDEKHITLDTWKSIHSICFADVYWWAGEIRTVNMTKDGTVFTYPEHILTASEQLFKAVAQSLERNTLTLEKLSVFFIEANVIHPFRAGNGRTQRILFSALFHRIGYIVDFSQTSQSEMLNAMVEGYYGDIEPTVNIFQKICRKTS